MTVIARLLTPYAGLITYHPDGHAGNHPVEYQRSKEGTAIMAMLPSVRPREGKDLQPTRHESSTGYPCRLLPMSVGGLNDFACRREQGQ